MPTSTRTYVAISIFSSRTFWWNAANGLLAVLSLSEVTTLIPLRFLPTQAAIVAVVNVLLRIVTVRPAAFIAPGTTKAVAVPSLGPPAPAKVTD